LHAGAAARNEQLNLIVQQYGNRIVAEPAEKNDEALWNRARDRTGLGAEALATTTQGQEGTPFYVAKRRPQFASLGR
jgi:hypothetical protein